MRVICLYSMCLAAMQCACASKADLPSPVTVTSLGTIRGSWMTTRKGRQIEAYRNIPYAEPPVGSLRFEEPRPITKYSHEVDATKDGPICPQPNVPESPGHMDEDCLILNVYTPRTKNSSSLLPVVVFLNYGAFYFLSSRSDVVGPKYLLDQDLILVTFNFRLASLGFLSTGDKFAPGNNGFKDQVVVLRWIQKNIAAFGGDPGSVTLLGCGSGSYSATLFMISPMTKGLFHRVVSISGSPFSQIRIGRDLSDLAKKQAKLVGCPSHSAKAIIECLKLKPWKEISDSVNEIIEDRALYWTIVVEKDFGQERFMPNDPLDVLRSGQLYSVPYIVSQTRDEFSWLANVILNNASLTKLLNEDYLKFAPKVFQLPKGSSSEALKLRKEYLGYEKLENDHASAVKLGKLFGDALTGFSAHRAANLMCRNSKAPVYYYMFDYIGKNSFYRDPTSKKRSGVAHHDDLIYLFSMPALFPDIGLDGSDADMVDKMTAIIYIFAKFGNPNKQKSFPELSQLSWPVMIASNRSYLRISTQFSVHQNLYEDRFSLWDHLFPITYTPKEQVQDFKSKSPSKLVGSVKNVVEELISGILSHKV